MSIMRLRLSIQRNNGVVFPGERLTGSDLAVFDGEDFVKLRAPKMRGDGLVVVCDNCDFHNLPKRFNHGAHRVHRVSMKGFHPEGLALSLSK
jgi:hypothetical protein